MVTAASLTIAVHSSSSALGASITACPWSRANSIRVAMKSDWSPLYRGLLPAPPCGPPGTKKFGKLWAMMPR